MTDLLRIYCFKYGHCANKEIELYFIICNNFGIFSAPEPKAQMHYCDHELSVPLSVRQLSLTFHIFDFFSETSEINSYKLDRKQGLNVLYQVCGFWTDRKNKMTTLASVWLRHF